jgi:thioredoxin-related protein
MSMMELKLNWMKDINEVLDVAKKTGKPALLFFHSEHCTGCTAMIEKTFPNKDVIEYVGHRFAPGAFEWDKPGSRDLVKKYGIEWTPTFLVADPDGNEVYRFVGYLPPQDFIAQLTLGLGKYALRKEDYDQADKCFESVAKKYPKTEAAPEGVYYCGVAEYQKTKDPKRLKAAYEFLTKNYADSDWAKKAIVWKDF